MVYTDAEGKVFGVVVILLFEGSGKDKNPEDGRIESLLHRTLEKHLFIPVHSIYGSLELFEQNVTLINDSWSNERKEYRLVLLLTEAAEKGHQEQLQLEQSIKDKLVEGTSVVAIQVNNVRTTTTTVATTTTTDLVAINDEIEDTAKHIVMLLDQKLRIEDAIMTNHVFQKPRSLTGKQTNVTPVPLFPDNNNSPTLCVWHKITKRLDQYREFHQRNHITHVVCLLTESEGSNDYNSLSEQCGIKQCHFPLAGAQIKYLSQRDTINLLVGYVKQIVSIIMNCENNQKTNILIHCSAGCHRTGIFTYLVLRLIGLDATRAKYALLLMRRETGVEVGHHRLALAENIIANLQ